MKNFTLILAKKSRVSLDVCFKTIMKALVVLLCVGNLFIGNKAHFGQTSCNHMLKQSS